MFGRQEAKLSLLINDDYLLINNIKPTGELFLKIK